MTLNLLLLCFIDLACLLVDLVKCSSCIHHTSESVCMSDISCDWFDTHCGCASGHIQDILFVMDESGSMGSTGFALEQDFVTEMIESGVDINSSIGIISFSTAVNNDWDFR